VDVVTTSPDSASTSVPQQRVQRLVFSRLEARPLLIPLVASETGLGDPAPDPAGRGRVTTSTAAARNRPRRDEALLGRLLLEVNRLRSKVRAGRDLPADPDGRRERHEQRLGLAEAMEAYAEAATSGGVPLPYRYRDEMRLHQAMTRGSRTEFPDGRADRRH